MDLSTHEKPVTFDFRHSHIVIPRRPNEGYKPVFDRPGVSVFLDCFMLS